jgi:hypothetical protein
MNRTYLKGIVSALAMAASAAFAQDQEPFTPATPAAGAPRLTPDASSSVMVKVDGSRVIDTVGQPIGRIENIVLSPVGCAEAAILAAPNGRLIPIPWTLVRVSGDTRVAGAMPGANLVFTVNTDQARLAQAPSFTRSRWPDMSNQTWLQGSIAFFGTGNAVGATGGSTNVVTGAGSGTTITGGNTNQIRVPLPSNTTGPDGGAILPPTGRTNQTLPDFQPSTPPPAQTVPPPQNNRPPSGAQPTPPPGAAGSALPPTPAPRTQP